MARFGNTGTFYYDPYGTVGASGGTFVYLTAGQMPQYPFSESMVTDKINVRNMGGQLWSYKNYSKATYSFRWTYLDESKVNELRTMFNANPAITWNTNNTLWGTFFVAEQPTISEVQHELYDLEVTIEEV
jgi:hypothetical protein